MGNSVLTTDILKNKGTGMSSAVSAVLYSDNGIVKTIDGDEEVSVAMLGGKTLDEVRDGINASKLGGYTASQLMSPYNYNKITKLIDTEDKMYPERYNIAVTESQDILFWGYNVNGWFSYGQGADVEGVYTIFNPNRGSNIKKVIATMWNIFVLYEDGKLYAMGQNTYNGLGVGNQSSQFRLVLSNTNVKEIATNTVSHHTSSYATIVIKYDNTVWGCGRNAVGNLGIGTNTDQLSLWAAISLPGGIGNPKKVYVAGAENAASYILTDTGKVLSCGYNGYGNLGDGSTVNKSAFTVIQALSDKNIVDMSVSSGTYNAGYGISVIALDDNGSVYTWGANLSGMLASGNLNQKNLPTLINAIPLPYHPVSNPIVKVYSSPCAHGGTSYVLTANGDLFACGENQYGQIGDNTTTDKMTFVFVKGNVKYFKTFAGNETSYYASCYAITQDNKLFAWGYNGQAQLGTQDASQKNVPTQIMFDYVSKITQISVSGIADSVSVSILLDDGRVYGVGDNDYQTVTPYGTTAAWISTYTRSI